MSSDRPSRPGVPPRRRPAQDDLEEPRQQRRDPRRRTAYVPRQDAPQPRRRPGSREDAGGRRRGPQRPRYEPQQAPYRTRQPEPGFGYDEDDLDYYDDPRGMDDRVIDDERAYAPPPRQRRPERRQSRQRPPTRDPYADVYAEPRRDTDYVDDEYDYDEGYEDSFIDEEDWYEEEAAAGAYSPLRQRAARQPRSMPRPSISMPRRPNIPRPVMPARVKEAALVQDQPALMLIGALILSAVAMALLTMNQVDGLAPGFATHVSASGIREAFRSETALWQLPLMAGALLLMNLILAWFLAGYSRFSSRFLLGTQILVQAIIWVALLRIAF